MLKLWDPRVLPARLVVRYVGLLFILIFVIANYILWQDTKSWDAITPHTPILHGSTHPIRKLMTDAKKHHEALVKKRSFDVADAAAKYRLRRGRHPPPGFDKWVAAAVGADSVIVEDYFDRIYKDLNPFWGLDIDTFTKQASAWHWVVKVRNGVANGTGDTSGRVPWLQNWSALVAEFAEHLPDLDMPINYMDEPRIFVPFEDMATLVQKEQRSRSMPTIDKTTTEFKGRSKIDAEKLEPYDPEWHHGETSYWDLSAATCPPDAPSHGVKALEDIGGPAEFPNYWAPPFSYKGFVQNYSASLDPCLQPHLRGLHGSFVEPLSLSSTTELIPMFGGSKLTVNSEILIPGAMYLAEDDERYSGGDTHGGPWPEKKDGVVWRGVGSGGRAKEESWHHFQRHRLLEMLNATTVSRMEATGNRSRTFELPSKGMYDSPRLRNGELGKWLDTFSDCAFISMCPPGECPHFDEYFHSGEDLKIPMKEMYNYKFLPDVDGNSFSARFRGFLRSTSAVLKASVYAEWHDDRLIPWVHFIPMDNTFQDLYSLLEFFADDKDGDRAAQYIADSGQAWSEKTLRREDMRIYVWRLLLEWARVCDENRDILGYVEDLR